MVDAAVILAGGSGRRLGGTDKPALRIAGMTLLERSLAAVGGAVTVVVGPERALPAGIRQTRENPPGSGPAAALAAGLAQLSALDDGATVALLAADLPAITADTVARLAAAVGAGTGAVLVDAAGRRQYLTGVFRLGPLRAAAIGDQANADRAGGDWAGRRLADLLDPLITTVLPGADGEADDIDVPDDLARWRDG